MVDITAATETTPTRHPFDNPLEPVDPWDRQPGEPRRAYRAFMHFRDLGITERTLRRVAQDVNRAVITVKHWSATYKWTDRVGAWDDDLARRRVIAAREANEEMARRQTGIALSMQAKAAESLQKINTENTPLTPYQIARFVEASFRAERTARGEPDKVAVEHSGIPVPVAADPYEVSRMVRNILADEDASAKALDLLRVAAGRPPRDQEGGSGADVG